MVFFAWFDLGFRNKTVKRKKKRADISGVQF